MTAQQLKNSILQMAVQGKLVPQDPSDEPASVLLERIRAEKEALIKAGKIKREKNPSVIFRGADNLPYEKCGGEVRCIADEVPFDIPDTWEWVRLGEIITLTSGQDLTPDKYNASGKGIPYITGASNIDEGAVLINRWTEYARAIAYRGNLLLTCKGTVGTMAFLQEDAVHIARQIMAIASSFDVNLKYLNLFMESFVAVLKASAKSMIPGIARDDVLGIYFPLPPVNEQQRIVDKFDALVPALSEYDSKEQVLFALNDAFPEKLKKSILQIAVQGKLVPQDPADEPASVLLERIREEKARLAKEGKIKRDKHESVIFRRDNSHYEKLDGMERCIDDEIPFEIPETWCWCRLGTLVTVKGGKRVPKGVQLSEVPTAHIYIRVTDMKNNTLTSDRLRYISDDVNQQIRNYTISKDDLYLTIAGTIGSVGIVPAEFDGMNLTENAVKLTEIRLDKHYLLRLISAPLVQEQFVDKTNQVAQPKLAIERIITTLIPIPPLSEQLRIVKAISEALTMIEGL